MLVTVPFAAAAAGNLDNCSMKAAKITPKTDLEKMATIKSSEAKQIALRDANGSSIVKGGIETEHGCLVYSYHVKDATGKGQTEILVDAGNGAVLQREHEGAARVALEKPVDKTKELAGKAKESLTDDPSTNHSMNK
jgi:uncharacterized membrane protein YkoI